MSSHVLLTSDAYVLFPPPLHHPKNIFRTTAMYDVVSIPRDSINSLNLPSKEWDEINPGMGGCWPGDPEAKRHTVTIKAGTEAYTLDVPEDRYIFHYFEEEGVNLPIINKELMCRQGCCTTCTVKVLEGEVESDFCLGLSDEMKQEGYRLSCSSYPRSDVILELQTEDEVYTKQWGDSSVKREVNWATFLPDD